MDVRPEVSEAVGVFFIVLVGGAVMLTGGAPLAVALAFGGVVMVLVYALGHVGGAHFNPAITVAFASTGHFPWRRVPTYLASQSVGALLASAALGIRWDLRPVVAHGPVSGGAATLVEALATSLLAFVILAVATDARAAAGARGLAIGAAVTLGSLAAGPLTGAAMNPARALGPAVAAGAFQGLAAHVVGPFVGAVAGMALYEALRRGRVPRPSRVLGAGGAFELEGPR
ncbi:MAG: aquaporin [Thermoplasmatota archaeon]